MTDGSPTEPPNWSPGEPPSQPPTFAPPPVAPPPGALSQPWGPPGAPPPGQQFQQPYGHPDAWVQQPAAVPYSGMATPEGWLPDIGRTLGAPWVRIGAKALDILMMLVVQFAITIPVVLVLLRNVDAAEVDSGNPFAVSGSTFAINLAAAAVLLAIDVGFNPVLTAKFGGTPGKLICGLRVIQRDGRPADWATAFKRWTPYAVLRIVSVVPLVGIVGSLGTIAYAIANLVMIFANERRVDLNDMFGDTYVVTKQA